MEVFPALEKVQSAIDNGLFAVGFITYEAASGFTPYLKTFTSQTLPLVSFVFFAERNQIIAGAELPKTYRLTAKWNQAINYED